MAKYRLEGDSYLDNTYFKTGSIIEWDGPPNRVMIPLDAEAKARVAAHHWNDDVSRPSSVRRPEALREPQTPRPRLEVISPGKGG
jgi:hypothetical protein